MSYIQFESAREKDKIRIELREAREQLLDKAKQSAEQRAKHNQHKVLSGESNWILPSISAKIDCIAKKNTSFKSKKKKNEDKKKKSKKSKKSSKKKKRIHSSSSESESEAEPSEKLSNTKRRSRKQSSSSDSSSRDNRASRRKKSKKRSSSSSTESDDNQSESWIEKPIDTQQQTAQRDSWMTDAVMLQTYSREKNDKKPNEKQQIDSYDPALSSRELNPYWKSTGTGLPSEFRKPKNDSDDETAVHDGKLREMVSASLSKNWKKKLNDKEPQPVSTSNSSTEDEETAVKVRTSSSAAFLTDQQMNELGAKIIKAEIMGNNDLANELKAKLETARGNRDAIKEQKQYIPAVKHDHEDHILLTRTDDKGNCRPLQQSSSINPNDLYGGRAGKKKSKPKRLETHEGGERVRFFADDDKYDIKQMFQREKYSSAADSNLQFADIVSKHKNPNDDLEDIFADKIRKNISKEETDRKEMSHAIHEQQKLSHILDNCDKCFDSGKMDKKLLIAMGESVYLALPWHIGLTPGHCVLAPTQHVACCTQLDENTWEEISNFRKALTKMFAAQKKDVVFFEIANKLSRHPHLSIHCVPISSKDAELAPFYFKKAIEESEHEWSVNKQLVSLRTKGLRNSIPKGLPYFWVNFGIDSGFAHVIEDEHRFPANFAQEIIGGLLNLDPSKWRRVQKEQNIITQVKRFADDWKKYDCTQ